MHPGHVVLYRDKSAITLAWVRREEGKSLRLMSEKGKEFPFPRDRVDLDLGPGGDGGTSPEAARQALARVRGDLDTTRMGIDLELLWESTREELPEGGPLERLARLWFGSAASPVQLGALLALLEEDRLWFKRKGHDHLPKDPEVVQETRRQMEEADRRRRQKEEALAWLKARMQNRSGPDALDPPGKPAMVELLVAAATLGEEGPRWSEAAAVLRNFGEPTSETAFRILVHLGVFGPDENLSLHEHGVPLRFPDAALEEAARLVETGPVAEDRLDLTGLPTLSIDDADTTEVDDALSLEARDDGSLRVWIHIADPSAFIPKGSLVDREALKRATTYYMPDRTLPMLPPVLSMDRCSLAPGVERPALTVQVDLDAEGEVKAAAFVASRVRVGKAWTYEDADAGIDADPQLAALFALAEKLRKRREADGAQSFERQELRIKVVDGEISVRKQVGDTRGQVLVSEFMVLANRLAGQRLAAAATPALYKRQNRPEEATPGYIPKSTLSLEAGEHYGLAVPFYCQMTSPIRRYGDLVIHRQLAASMGRPIEGHSREELETVLGICLDREAASHAVQREGRRYWLLRYLERLDPREHDATVGSIRRGGLIQVRLDEFLLPCMLPIPQGIALAEGDRVRVAIQDVDARRNRTRIQFRGMILAPLPA